jgi:hypothetical protein
MTFDELKATILQNTRQFEICPVYQQVLIATDYPSLIAAGMSLIVWSYQTGVVPDDLIAELPESDLNAAGIYTTGTFSLSNPATDIYVVKNAIVNISLNGNNKCNITIMGASQTTLAIAGNAYAEIKSYNTSVISSTISDQASQSITGTDQSQITVVANGGSVTYGLLNNKNVLNYTGNNNSYGLIKSYNQSTINILALNDAAAIKTIPYNSSVVNQPEISL